METLSWIVAGLFLPLFPLGMVFNFVYQRCANTWIRVLIMLAWPLPGIWILQDITADIPTWVMYWALFSSVLYGFRAVVVKEFSMWAGFLATSAWSLIWIAMASDIQPSDLVLHALAFSLPLALLAFLVMELETRFGSAYVSVVSGVAQAHPRLSFMLVITMMAVIGSPMFPAFFSMLDTLTHVIVLQPAIAIGVVVVWLFWSWSGVRLLQELLVGTASQGQSNDISHAITATYSVSLILLACGGLYTSGVLL